METWDSAIEQAISNVASPFDSHELIQEIAHRNQRRYLEALAALDSDIPFQILHSRLGRQIKVVAERLGYRGEPSRSDDIFGQYSECVKYSRHPL